MKTYKIAAIPGDGIGTEVVAAGIEVLNALADREGSFDLQVDHFDWGGEYYKEHGRMTGIAQPVRIFRIPSQALIAFLILTFGITWGLIGVYILRPEWASATFGAISGSHPFFFIATWAPAISAFALLLYIVGPSGVKAFLARLLLWRCSFGWLAFVLIGIPIVYATGSLLKGGPVLAPIPSEGIGALVAVLFMEPNSIEPLGHSQSHQKPSRITSVTASSACGKRSTYLGFWNCGI